jgi:hypothetical protein
LFKQLSNIEERLERLNMALVQIDESDLAGFAAAINAEVGTIGAAVTSLTAYIKQLVAGQAVALPAADESAINTALSALSASVGSLSALEPPAPAPGS